MAAISDDICHKSPVYILNSEAKVYELIDPDIQWWNIPLIKEIFMEKKVEKICSMVICPRTQHDKAVWMGNKNGDFSVHSALVLIIWQNIYALERKVVVLRLML